MFTRLMRTSLAVAACLFLFTPAASAEGLFSRTGKSGQVYTWSAGHC